MNKGYDPENMNTDTLKSMDFSYGSPDSPPSGDQTGDRSKDRTPIKSQTAGTHRKPARLAPLKKTNTVMWERERERVRVQIREKASWLLDYNERYLTRYTPMFVNIHVHLIPQSTHEFM